MVSQASFDRIPYPVAPLGPAALARALAPFGESAMLPPAAYTDPAVFDWERRHFFGGGWMCVARRDQLPGPGDQRAEDTGSGGVLLVCGDDGTVRAFANTCRHRGHELLPCGSAAAGKKAIVCPYHAWTYGLDGQLRGAPGYRGEAGGHPPGGPPRVTPRGDPAQWGLSELPAAEWHGLIFVDGSGGDAGPLPLAELDPIVAPYEPERLVTAATHAYDSTANWKILTENYQECYHCPSIHPELCRVTPPASGENYDATGAWIGGWMELRPTADSMSFDGHSDGFSLRGLSGGQLRQVIYLSVFPNVLLSLHPDYVMTHLIRPVGPDRTRIDCSWAFAPEAVARPGFDPAYAVDFWDLTNRQDWAACESVQRGLSSPHALPGPLAPGEDAVYSFVTTVARGYLGERPAFKPAGVSVH